MKSIRYSLLAGVLLTASVNAHHASAPHFDANKPVTISGVITEFKFVNPHAYIYLDVASADGTVTNWNCEMSAASGLRRFGWSQDLFPVGETISIEGTAARRDPAGCAFQNGVLSDGTRIARSGTITSGEAQIATTADETPQAEDVDLTSLEGRWITTPRGAGGGGPPSADRFAGLITAAGEAANASYDERYDDPALNCSPSSIARGWGEPDSPSEIIFEDDQIVIKHEYMDTQRIVHLTDRFPDNLTPRFLGYSIGEWDGDTLVIHTKAYEAGVLLPHPGILHTDQMETVERLYLSDDGQQLIREYTVTDPEYLTRPYSGRSSWTRTTRAVSTYNCTELSGVNNIRPDSE